MTKTGMVASALVLGLWTAALAVQAAEQVKTIEVNRPLRGLECVRYKAVAHFKPEQGSVTLDCTLKFAADKIVKLEDVKSSAQATYTFLTFVLNRGHRITVGYSTLKGRLFLYAYETASRRHVFIEEFDVGWKEGERHRITVSWGAFLT
ncbi:MAG: hypothetical protein FJ279_12575, partial [Planctomycetes bacterium]|nr:hypothetical protein [Planctomycetota bacterium]